MGLDMYTESTNQVIFAFGNVNFIVYILSVFILQSGYVRHLADLHFRINLFCVGVFGVLVMPWADIIIYCMH